MGIPDLRGKKSVTSTHEAALVDRLTLAYPNATFEELALMRVCKRSTTSKQREHFSSYFLDSYRRGKQFYSMFKDRLEDLWGPFKQQVGLDLGCGIGPGLMAMKPDFEFVIGLDTNLSSLLVAKKRLEQESIKNVMLVQGSALLLPFRCNIFDLVISINVLEHVFEPINMFEEVRRVLNEKGRFAGDSRNRYDLFFKEPHVELRWLGFLPRKWMAPYVQWHLNVPYDHTYLLSYGDLRNALVEGFGREWHITVPSISAYGQSVEFSDWVIGLMRNGLISSLLVRLTPAHLVLVRKL